MNFELPPAKITASSLFFILFPKLKENSVTCVRGVEEVDYVDLGWPGKEADRHGKFW